MLHIISAYNELTSPFRIFFSEKESIKKCILNAILILVFIFVEYYFQISSSNTEVNLLIIYSLSLLLPISIYLFYTKRFFILRSFKFWLLFSSVVFSIYMFDTNHFYTEFIRDNCPLNYRYIAYRITYQIIIWMYFLVPFITWKLLTAFFPLEDGNHSPQEKLLKIKYSSYILIVLPMLILVVGASFFSSFRSFYPRAPVSDPLTHQSIGWNWVLLFEIVYILAFFATEWFFRKFLIESFSTFFGIDSVLIITFLYVAIHFQKPLLETISSSLGGFALGLISYSTGQIRGGILIHVSIAVLMEVMGFYWMTRA